MKKYTLLLVGTLLFSVFSCQEKTEHTFIETKTILYIDIPIISKTSADRTGLNLINSKEYYSFFGEGSYSATQLVNSEEEMYNVQHIRPEQNSDLSISGIKENDLINNLVLEWGYKTSDDKDFVMQEPVNLLLFKNTISNGRFVVNIDEVLAKMFKNNVNRNHTLKIQITGSLNKDFTGNAIIEVPVTVQSELITARYELF